MLSAILAVASFAAVSPVFSQTPPAAYQAPSPFTIGAGASNFNVDWGRNRMFGYSIWGDWHLGTLPRPFDGLGIEFEARDLAFDRGADLGPSFRQDTLGAGPMYTFRHYRRFRPFGKLLIDYGRLDNDKSQILTTSVLAPAIGFEVHAIPHLWVRADYEYQIWSNLLNGKDLDPQGFTLGVSYDFRSFRSFR
jgi:hypothetical protein